MRRVSFDLQPRDVALLRDLFDSRLMRLDHIAALHFEGRREAAKKRVQRLKAAGLIAERARRSFEPAVHVLTMRGIDLLDSRGELLGFPPLSRRALEKRSRVSDLTVRHELEVMDVKAALIPALRAREGLSIAEFTTWPRLCEFRAQRPDTGQEMLVKPDGFFRVAEATPGRGVIEHAFFLEVDRSTETLETLANRAACYVDFYRRGGYAVRRGQSPAERDHFPFRVLLVCKSEQRLDNIALHLLSLQPPILTQVWLTERVELLRHPQGAVWLCPADYRKIGSPMRRPLVNPET